MTLAVAPDRHNPRFGCTLVKHAGRERTQNPAVGEGGAVGAGGV